MGNNIFSTCLCAFLLLVVFSACASLFELVLKIVFVMFLALAVVVAVALAWAKLKSGNDNKPPDD